MSETKSKVLRIPQLVGTVMVILAIFSPNPFLSLAALGVLGILIRLFWRPGEPPVLLFIMAYHWVQAAVVVFNADLEGQALEGLGDSHALILAAWLSLLGILAVSLGIRSGCGRNTAAQTGDRIRSLVARLSIQRLFLGSLAAIAGVEVLQVLGSLLPPLRQPLLALTNLHWVVIYMFTYAALTRREGYRKLLAVFLLELLMGFMGFFSNFQQVIYVVLLAALAAPGAFRGVRLRTAVATGLLALSLGLVWTAIKKDYRSFLNQGSGDQTVLVPVEARIRKLVALTSDLDSTRLSESLKVLGERLSYIEYFGMCIESVPATIPHEGGRLWGEALEHALVPRLLYPDKPVLNDTLRTNYYTRGFVSTLYEGTSISLGYMAESYIDFGPFLMFLPLYLWGCLVGLCYRILVRATPFPLLGYGTGAVILFINAMLLETSNVKMVAGLLNGFLVLFLAQRYLGKRLLSLFCSTPEPAPPARSGGQEPRAV